MPWLASMQPRRDSSPQSAIDAVSRRLRTLLCLLSLSDRGVARKDFEVKHTDQGSTIFASFSSGVMFAVSRYHKTRRQFPYLPV